MNNETVAMLEKYLPKLESGGKELLELATRRVLTLATIELFAGILLLLVGLIALVVGFRKWEFWGEYLDDRRLLCGGIVVATIITGLILIPDSIVGLLNIKFYAIRSLLP